MSVPQYAPQLGMDEIGEALQVFESRWLTEGPKTAELERLLREYTGSRHVLMVPNGTLALFAALKVLDIGPGDEVLVPDFTFFGSASAVILAGAKPVFVDVDSEDFTIDIAAARHCLSEATAAVMPVHIYGRSCRMEQVMSFAREYGLKVVEDAAQGIGVRFGSRHVGTFGNVGCISFFADKTITTGEGGALLVQDDELAEKCMYFKNQGRLQRGSFIHPRMGYNFRITDLQAAVGAAQMRKLDTIIRQKHALLNRYRETLADCTGVTFSKPNDLGDWVPFRINILVDDPGGLIDHLADRGVSARRFFYPLHLQPSLTPCNSVVRSKPVQSIRAFERGISLPSGVDLNDEAVEHVCRCIREYTTCRM